MTSISFTITNKQNFPGMGDLPPILDFDDTLPVLTIDSVYGNVDFSYDINFRIYDNDSNELDIISVNNTSKPNFVSKSIIDFNTIRFNKNNINAFPGEEYIFSYIDQNYDIIQTTNIDDDVNTYINQWVLPDNMILDVNYTFEIEHYTSPFSLLTTTTTVILDQKIYWFYKPSLDSFMEYVNK